ncbi:MAG TPA: hypothetical protein ENO24_05465 [Chloroflexi bacterium]|nr:hypothetical protein [Chloroflexota bacterium]
MVRQFSLADILLVKRLQEQAACLDLETALLWSPAPLSLAVMEYMPLGQGASTTLVENSSPSHRQAAQGFLQAWGRPDGLSCHVGFIAPALDGSSITFRLWCDLLEHLTVAKGSWGLERILARVPEDGRAVDAFRQTGFSVYSRRRVLRFERDVVDATPSPSSGFRPLTQRDAPAVLKLHHGTTPRPVQHAEGSSLGRYDPTPVLPWWKSHHIKEYVSEQDGEILAYLHILFGQRGQWLTIVLGPGTSGKIDALLSEALESAGFDEVASEAMMVKHTTARAKIAVNKLSPALEKGVETAAPISSSQRRERAL